MTFAQHKAAMNRKARALPSPLAADVRRASVQTFSGPLFDLESPDASEVRIADIAHSLSMQCRYNGHCRFFYSVAEHSVHIARHASPRNRLWGLLHDAPEGYIGDLVSPIKITMAAFRELEARVMVAIAERFGLSLPEPPEIKTLDIGIRTDERAALLPPLPPAINRAHWGSPLPVLGVEIQCWSPAVAERKFLDTFRQLTEVTL